MKITVFAETGIRPLAATAMSASAAVAGLALGQLSVSGWDAMDAIALTASSLAFVAIVALERRDMRAANAHRQGPTPFFSWLTASLDFDPNAWETHDDLYASYRAWMARYGLNYAPLGFRAFGTALGEHQVLRDGRTEDGRIIRVGARLRARPAESVPPSRPSPSPDRPISGRRGVAPLQAAVSALRAGLQVARDSLRQGRRSPAPTPGSKSHSAQPASGLRFPDPRACVPPTDTREA